MENYIVSARKYRPMTFSSVVGQEALTTTLKNTVKSGKLAHAYLFCGPRGVGKTTCARIFAKAINCESPTADGEACNECESCKAFNEGRSMNIFELDAASNNSVENIRSLMEQTQIPPQVGRYKVFIIDEVHMLSTSAFNAFLKTLEEPPQHVIFILATTEKHKILPTILSRCQIYDFERMTVPNIIHHLEMVAKKENIEYEEEALNIIAEKADGGMRDALSIFDQVASFSQGKITYQKVIEDLNVLDADNYFKLVDMALENRVSDMMLLLNGIISKGFDPGLLVDGLASHLRNVLMARDASTLPLLETSDNMKQRYQQQAAKCKPNFIYKALKILTDCDLAYRQSSNKRLLVELSLIRVAQLTQPDDDVEGAGRSPKRLKSLFKNIKRMQPKPAQQVAGVASRANAAAQQKVAAATTAAVSSTAAATSSMTTRQTPAAVPSATRSFTPHAIPSTSGKANFKLSNIGMTFAQLKAKNEQKQPQQEVTEESEKSVGEERNFTDDELRMQWTLMCNRMPHEMVGLAARLKNITPKVTEYPTVEAVVDNKSLLEQVTAIQRKIRATLRATLHNNSIEFVPRLAEPSEHQRIYTKRELFDTLRKENPALERLRTSLGLELA